MRRNERKHEKENIVFDLCRAAAALPEDGAAGENPGGTEDEETAPETGEGEASPDAESGNDVQSEGDAAGEPEAGDGEGAGEPAPENPFAINKDNYVDVEVIDLSLHGQETGEFTPVYEFDNPFFGKDTSQGAVFEFYAKPTWEVHVLSTIFAIVGTDDYDGRIYFTPGSYFGFNSANFGGYFDANLYNYTIVTDYIKSGAKIRIEMLPTGFAVYADNVLCYDQTILGDIKAAAGDFTPESDFAPVLEWLAGAQKLYFGYGAWWNTAGSDEANINLSEVSFRLMDGTVLFDQLQADKALVELLGGSVDMKSEQTGGMDITAGIADVEVELFDISSVEYEAHSIFPVMAAIVAVVAVIATGFVIFALKKREYDDI